MLFIRALDIGGSQRQVALLARGLARRGHDVAVVLLYSGGLLESTLTDSGVRILTLGKRGRWHVFGPLMRLWKALVRERPDVLYAFLPTQAVISALLLPPWLDTKLVFGVRATEMRLDRYDRLSSFAYRLQAWLAWRADLIIANAVAIRADASALGLPADRIAVVPNGIDTDAMRPDAAAGREFRKTWNIGETDFVIGLVARLDPMKDHATFLAAAADFARHCSDARFVCVGDGSPRSRTDLAVQARILGLGERFVHTGECTDVRGAYNAFDVATLTSSYGEAFPNAIGEAMACGVPVVATDVGDARAIIATCGDVVAVGRPEALSEAWARLRTRLMSDRVAMAAAARARIVEVAGEDLVVGRTEELLARLCRGEPGRDLAGHRG